MAYSLSVALGERIYKIDSFFQLNLFVSLFSCAAPVVSGIFALLNDQRLSAGKKPLGFLNPFIYQTYANHPDAFIDIVGGNNQNGCCGVMSQLFFFFFEAHICLV